MAICKPNAPLAHCRGRPDFTASRGLGASGERGDLRHSKTGLPRERRGRGRRRHHDPPAIAAPGPPVVTVPSVVVPVTSVVAVRSVVAVMPVVMTVRPVVTPVTPVIAITSVVDAVTFGGAASAVVTATSRLRALQRDHDRGGDRNAQQPFHRFHRFTPVRPTGRLGSHAMPGRALPAKAEPAIASPRPTGE